MPRSIIIMFAVLFAEVKREAEESCSTSTASESVVEKGEVEATKEGEKEKDNKNEKEADTDKEKDGTNEQEVVFIQDMGFTVKIISPGAEPFDIQVSSMELVQVMIRHVIMKNSRLRFRISR